jgi:hyperosmotically inducible protein
MEVKMTRRLDASPLLALALMLPLAACAGTTARTGSPNTATTMNAGDDATITARVKTVLLNDPQINATRIDVSTSNGVVTISGAVKSTADEQRAIQLARQVNGVKDVKSTLQVAGG